MADRSLAAISIRESLIGIAWVAVVLATLFVFPNLIANTVMIISTCLAAALCLLPFVIGNRRGRVFACGAIAPIVMACVQVPDALGDLPFFYRQSLIVLASTPISTGGSVLTVNEGAIVCDSFSDTDADPFADLSSDPFSGPTSSEDPFADLVSVDHSFEWLGATIYSRFHLFAAALHLLAAVLGYGMLVIASWLPPRSLEST